MVYDINKIYKNITHSLTNEEIENLDKVWEFIECFNYPKINLHKFRKQVISKIRSKYSLHEFLVYEKVIEKLLFNLKDRYFDQNKDIYTKIKIIELNKEDNLNKKIREFSANCQICLLRSFINKNFYFNYSNNKLYFTPTKGSSDILEESRLDSILNTVMYNRESYEMFMLDNSLNDIDQFYYSFDYPFPNIFTDKFNIINDKDREIRIDKLYFSGGEKMWFKLIKK